LFSSLIALSNARQEMIDGRTLCSLNWTKANSAARRYHEKIDLDEEWQMKYSCRFPIT
jgi:hypothetical protein